MLGNGVYGRSKYFDVFCYIALALFTPGSADGATESNEIVTLESAAREAVGWHPSIVEAIGRLNARAEQIEVAEAGYLPQISGGIGSSYDNTMRTRWRPRANISASQMLYDFGKVSSSVAIAEAGTKIGRAQLLLAVDGLIRDTSYAMIEIQRTAALHQVALDQLESISSINELVDHRYRRGAATRSDALQAQARVQAAEVAIQEIEAEQQRWKSNLAHLLGRQIAPEISSDIPDWLLASCARGEPRWANIPAIMQVKAQRDQALAELDESKAFGLPTVSLGAGAATDIDRPFARRTDYNFGINVSSNLYNGGGNRARTRSATFALGAADAAEASVRNEVSRLLAEAQRQVASLTDALQTLDARQESMRETGMLYRRQYLDMGTRTLVDLLNAEQELHQARFDLVNTRHDIRRLQVDCLFNSGAEREAFGLSGTMVRGVEL